MTCEICKEGKAVFWITEKETKTQLLACFSCYKEWKKDPKRSHEFNPSWEKVREYNRLNK